MEFNSLKLNILPACSEKPGLIALLKIMEHTIKYSSEQQPKTEQIIELYRSSGISRPIDDFERIRRIYQNSNLVVTAWDDEILVGVARSITDFAYCCYLSDLAVRSDYQRKGIGKRLIELTKESASDQSMLLLLSAPGAMQYYPKIGFGEVKNGFIINRIQ